ncbi:zf-HC2 domain-containing protein [bacterium]|nr:zf-HC2 domain-containing protein [bacterium]
MNRPADNSERLSAYLDGELPEEESAGLRATLLENESWRKQLDELCEVNRLLVLWDQREMQGIHASADFERRLFCRLRGLLRPLPPAGSAPDDPIIMS